MSRFLRYIFVIFAATTLLAGCRPDHKKGRSYLALRASVDSRNKNAFVNRYDDPSCAIHESYEALELLRDSLPDYLDGQLRAYNNMAFAYYMLAEHDSASVYVDSVLDCVATTHQKAKNADVEQLIAQLIRIRLLQRSCKIADSYQQLYDIEKSSALKHKPDNYLYAFAQMEYYITSLTLNYHYRNGVIESSSSTLLSPTTKHTMKEMLEDIEKSRKDLRCDYAEDMSLNYAMAHSYYRLASATGSDPALLRKSYDYLAQNLRILSYPNQYCIYHLANVFQLQAFIVADTNISPLIYEKYCTAQIRQLDSLGQQLYPADSMYLLGDYGLDMFRISTDLFFQTSDPYQHLGAVVAAAEYCRSIGAYDEAYRYYTLILNDTTWHDGMAPKFESMLYDGLIRSGFASTPEDRQLWYDREMDIQNFIQQNERADMLTQDRIFQLESRTHYYIIAIAVILLFLGGVTLLAIMLRRRTLKLKAETQALQEAKQQDVERIANVETCLSVMRHDVNPFLSYLQNKKLSPELRQEVLDQLIRTFSNIKNWTNLSIPSGMQFQPTTFSISEAFQSVESTCINIHDNVSLRFTPTPLTLWGDKQLVEIMLRNLVNNALQHTTQGTVTVSAETYSSDERFVHLTVTDTGCGMDEETLDNLFRADKTVRTVSDPNASHGTGFGLILCKYIIKRHDDNTLRGCRIWAESTPDQGTSMHIILTQGKES